MYIYDYRATYLLDSKGCTVHALSQEGWLVFYVASFFFLLVIDEIILKKVVCIKYEFKFNKDSV
jgi:hypothetical protein